MEKALGLKTFNLPLFLIHRLLFTVCVVVIKLTSLIIYL